MFFLILADFYPSFFGKNRLNCVKYPELTNLFRDLPRPFQRDQSLFGRRVPGGGLGGQGAGLCVEEKGYEKGHEKGHERTRKSEQTRIVGSVSMYFKNGQKYMVKR